MLFRMVCFIIKSGVLINLKMLVSVCVWLRFVCIVGDDMLWVSWLMLRLMLVVMCRIEVFLVMIGVCMKWW